MKRPGRRSILRMIALLLAWLIAGATLNVAVAWGLACWSQRYLQRSVSADECLTLISRYNYRPDGYIIGYRMFHLGMIETAVYNRDVGITYVETVRRVECGVPFHCFTGEYFSSMSSASKVQQVDLIVELSADALPRPFRARPEAVLPLRPLWPGFAINTLFYAGVLWVLCCGPFALRRMIRRRRGQCPHCAYPIGQSPVCTECGAAVPAKAANA